MLETGAETSIAAALGEAVQRLELGGIPYARREATALWAACDGLRPAEVFLRREGIADRATAARFWEAVRRRASGAPFAYVVGRMSFRSLEVQTDSRALIPRPETEGLVELVLRWADAKPAGGVAADIGTGCGCIALALAVEGPFEQVLAVDSSPDAVALARENVARLRPHVPVEVRLGDLVEPLAGRRCRVIVANPPYLTDAEWEALDPAVKAFEPRLALASGADGLVASAAILAGAGALLESGGLLALEIDERRAAAVHGLAAAHGWRDVTIQQDLFGRPRYLLAHPS